MATFAFILFTVAPAAKLFAEQGQTPENLMAENIVELAKKANVQVKSLIDSVYTDETTLQKTADAGFNVQLDGNVSLYNQGTFLLTEAENALENTDYVAAIDNARSALQVFRQVFKSINWILVDSGLKTVNEVDTSGLLDAVNRTVDAIAHLRELLPSNATDQIAGLDQAEALLNLVDIKNLILEGKINIVADNLRQANELTSRVYQYLKLQAEEFNTVRIREYLGEMQQARERMRERFQYAESLGLNVDGIFEALGYRNETEFMNALQNMTQSAESEMNNFTAVMNDLEALGQMVQNMNQTLTQEMNRYQMQHGSDGIGGMSNGSGSQNSGTNQSDAGTSGYGSGTNNSNPGTVPSDSGAGSGGTGTSSGTTTNGGNGYMGPGTPDAGNGSSPGVGGSGR